MISIFTIPKGFSGHTGVIQRNAIESWIRSIEGADVMLMADDPGVADVARELGIRHFPATERNEFGTPLLDSAFRTAVGAAKYPTLAYINSDIILTPEFVPALGRIPFDGFLAVGRRTDLDVRERIDFTGDWLGPLTEKASATGRLMHPYGSDYFVFPSSSTLTELPRFAVGRPGWDNWFMARARELSLPVVDLTTSCLVIHQNHGYGHVAGARGPMWEGPEGDRNRAMAGTAYGSILDADYRLTPRGLKRNGRARRAVLRVLHAIDKRLPRRGAR